MKNFKPFYLIPIFVSIAFLGIAQMDTINFYNPSFEGNPNEGGLFSRSLLPKGWTDCGFRGETAPDVHPVSRGNFGVSQWPAHGDTYIGMVTRDNDTWEKMGQKLTKPLEAGKCYLFSVALARSETYLSQSRVTDKPANYVKPIKLRIYGGNGQCEKDELLAETSLIKNSKWLIYSLIINPDEDYRDITLEAFYKTPTLFPYNGNILVDDLSPIIEIPCDSDSTQAKIVEIDKVRQKESNSIADKARQEQSKSFVDKTEEKEKKYELNRIQKEEEQRLTVERRKAALNLTKEKLSELVEVGLFRKKEGEINPDGAEIFEQIVTLLKANPRIKVDFALKKKGGKNAINLRKKYLEDTLLDNGINPYRFDIDKFSNYEPTNWPFENKRIAINAYK